MAYQGYLIKVGDYVISQKKFLAPESFKAVPNIQDLDPERDADGKLHRNALEHIPIKVEFNTPAMLTNMDMSEFFSNIQRNYINELERKANVTVYVPEYDDYITQEMYMAQPEPTIYAIFEDNIIRYNALRIAFIGY